jgi:hypothetical protein
LSATPASIATASAPSMTVIRASVRSTGLSSRRERDRDDPQRRPGAGARAAAAELPDDDVEARISISEFSPNAPSATDPAAIAVTARTARPRTFQPSVAPSSAAELAL